MTSQIDKETSNEQTNLPTAIAIPSRNTKESKESPKTGEGELVVPDDAMDEPKWCFVAYVIK